MGLITNPTPPSDPIQELRDAYTELMQPIGNMTADQPMQALQKQMRWKYACSPTAIKTLLDVYDTATTASAPAGITEALLKEMVNRFLGWKLPETFGPDCFVTFDREKAKANHSWPIGTNLLSAIEARQMLQHVLGALGEMKEQAAEGPLREGWSMVIGPGPEGYGVYAQRMQGIVTESVCLCTIDPNEYPDAEVKYAPSGESQSG
jgi:hypothetical protein